MLKAYKKVPSGKVAIYGQELNAQTWALCTMNMFLHGVDDARIWQGDTLSNPQNVENDNLMKFQVVVANPPFSLDKWDSGFLSEAEVNSKGKKKMSAELDQYHRFDWGVPPTSKGDYAFVLHMLSSLDAENGRMAVVLPHGVLFRGASEGKNTPSACGNESTGCGYRVTGQSVLRHWNPSLYFGIQEESHLPRCVVH